MEREGTKSLALRSQMTPKNGFNRDEIPQVYVC
jgi:hypothetical protein